MATTTHRPAELHHDPAWVVALGRHLRTAPAHLRRHFRTSAQLAILTSSAEDDRWASFDRDGWAHVADYWAAIEDLTRAYQSTAAAEGSPYVAHGECFNGAHPTDPTATATGPVEAAALDDDPADWDWMAEPWPADPAGDEAADAAALLERMREGGEPQ